LRLPTGASLRPSERLRRPSEFQRAFRRGSRRDGRLFQLVGLPNGLEWSRLGLTVGRKVGAASVRNRAKRQLREAFRRNKPLFARPHDLVIVARGEMRGRSYAEVEREYRIAVEELVRRSERRNAGAARPD
jgi:ribonuclease P protein component